MKWRLAVAGWATVMVLAAAAPVLAEGPKLAAGDTLQTVLAGYQDKQVTVRLSGGEELSGKVVMVSKELLHLQGLAGREFFDGLVDMGKIEAVIVRTQ